MARSRWQRGYPKIPTPWPGPDGGGSTLRYLSRPGPEGKGGGTARYLAPAKVPTPNQVQTGVTPRYLSPPPQPGPDGGGIPQGTYPPSPSQDTYSPSPRIGQHMENLIRHSRYASSVHAAGLSCISHVIPHFVSILTLS